MPRFNQPAGAGARDAARRQRGGGLDFSLRPSIGAILRLDAGVAGFKLSTGERVEVVRDVTLHVDFDNGRIGWLSFTEGAPSLVGYDPDNPPAAARDPGAGRVRWGALIEVAAPAGVPGLSGALEPQALAITSAAHLDAFGVVHGAWAAAVGDFDERVAVVRDTAWRAIKRAGRTFYSPELKLLGLAASLDAPLDDDGPPGASARGDGRGGVGDDAGGDAIGDDEVGGAGDAGEVVVVRSLRSEKRLPRAEAPGALATLFDRARPSQVTTLWQRNRKLIVTLDREVRDRLAAVHDAKAATIEGE